MTEQTTRVVRARGSGRTHVADIPTALIAAYQVFGSGFVGAALPLATRCGSALRGKGSAAVCMEPGTQVSCSGCVRVTGISAAGERNNWLPVARRTEEADTTPGGDR